MKDPVHRRQQEDLANRVRVSIENRGIYPVNHSKTIGHNDVCPFNINVILNGPKRPQQRVRLNLDGTAKLITRFAGLSLPLTTIIITFTDSTTPVRTASLIKA